MTFLREERLTKRRGRAGASGPGVLLRVPSRAVAKHPGCSPSVLLGPDTGSARSLCLCSGGRGRGVTVPAGGLPGSCRPQTPPRPHSLCRCPTVTGLGPAARTPSNSSAGVKTPPRVGSRSRCGGRTPTALGDTVQPPTVTRQFLSLEDVRRTGSAAEPLAGHHSPAGRWAPLCPPFLERGLGAGTLGLQARVKACPPWPLGPGVP